MLAKECAEEFRVECELRVPSKAQDDAQNTALITAVKAGDVEMVQRLLNLGADPDIESIENKTACGYARENGAEEILKLLGA